jgi:hypothetical protein
LCVVGVFGAGALGGPATLDDAANLPGPIS